MRKASGKLSREELLRQMQALALARVNDAVKLAYLSGEDWDAIDSLDLSALTEFKRSGSGAVEIRLTDRMQALEKLMDLLQDRQGAGQELLRALAGGEEEREP